MLLYEALATPLDDIFYQDIAGEDWSKLLGIYTAHEFADNRKVVKAYRNFYSNLAIGNAVLSKQQQDDHPITKMIMSGLYSTYYLLNKQKRFDQFNLANTNPELEVARDLWNLMDSEWMQHAIKIIMPSIKVNKKIYVPMVDTVLTRDNIN